MRTSKTTKYYDFAFFTAFTTIPDFVSPVEFFCDEIEKMFQSYRQSLNNMTDLAKAKSTKAIDSKLDYCSDIAYKPVPYCLLGEFDMAIFSLIDDFSFATKKFKPDSTNRNFKYQVNTGIIPLIDLYKSRYSRLSEFRNKMLVNFISEKDFFPFTGITTIKLNNSMLVGVGQDFIDFMNYFFVKKIDEFIEVKSINNSGYRLFYIINENLGWNEITINFFGNNIQDINEIATRIRIYRLRDIYQEFKVLGVKYDSIKLRQAISSIRRKLLNNSLLNTLISKSRRKGNQFDLFESHPVVASSTVFGYHIANIKNIDPQFKNKSVQRLLKSKEAFTIYNEAISAKCISISWDIKPGHELNSKAIVQQALKHCTLENSLDFNKFLNTTFSGKYAFVFPEDNISLKQYFEFIFMVNTKFRNEFKQNVIKFRSRLKLINRVDFNPFDTSKHYNYDLNEYKIDQARFQKVRSSLRILSVPHIIKSQVENLIFNFNDAITDPLMYNYFIGLRLPLLSFLKEKLNDAEEGDFEPDFDTIHGFNPDDPDFDVERMSFSDNKKVDILSTNVEDIVNFIKTWNKAYWNRYFHSYYFTEISDFNIEHHGGIQQILFCYDMIYKNISKRIYGDSSKEPFVNVRIAHVITSTRYSNTINFTHLFRPAVYSCECVHEAANHILEYLIVDLHYSEYSFLFNPSKDIVVESTIRNSAKFEAGIKKLLGSKDSFEESYIENYFGINTLRYIFTDYVTFRLAYNLPRSKKKNSKSIKPKLFSNLKMFYHTQWFLYLTKSELFVQNRNDDLGGWYFEEKDFKFLFIRLNLMFFLFFGYRESQLRRLNSDCPSIELSVYWGTLKDDLISFVCRLGDSIKIQFGEMKGDDTLPTDFFNFKTIIESEILQKNNLSKAEKILYDIFIQRNHELIIHFHDFFAKVYSVKQTNAIIRQSKNEIVNGIETNVDFYPQDGERKIFLDPKGNIFCTSEIMRKEILKSNILYLKDIWDVSMINATLYY